MTDDDAYHHGNNHRREGGQIGGDAAGGTGHETLAQQACHDRGDNHIYNTGEHADGIDIYHGAGHEPYQQRGEHGRQEGRAGGHAYRQSQIALGQIGDDIRGGATRTTAHEDDA